MYIRIGALIGLNNNIKINQTKNKWFKRRK